MSRPSSISIEELGGHVSRKERANRTEKAGRKIRTLNLDQNKEEVHTPCQADPDSWYDVEEATGFNSGNMATAKRICRTECELRRQCLNVALMLESGRPAGGAQSGERWGVWGGLDPHERELEERKRRAEGTWEWD